ncbi:MAG: hypothetical protein OEZ19_00045 [Paracoccaceae bacterium]|nr:hypothetical protein [Paracoccaceae bacterium]
MSYAITTADVLDGFTTGASTADLDAYIAVADQADTCLTANGVSVAIGKQLKVLGVRHLAANANDRGAVTQERAVSGASRSYSERLGGETGYLQTLRTIDQYGCVMAAINNNARVQLRSVGRRAS